MQHVQSNSIWNRKLDLLYFVFFCTHVPVMFGMFIFLLPLTFTAFWEMGYEMKEGVLWTVFGL